MRRLRSGWGWGLLLLTVVGAAIGLRSLGFLEVGAPEKVGASSRASLPPPPRAISAKGEGLPHKTRVRSESEAAPHAMPPSLLRWSLRQARSFEAAGRDESAAAELLGQLQDCIVDSKLADSARALCLRNARLLGIKHPRLGARVQSLEANAPGEIQSLCSELDQL